jgi:peptide/nickel transport system substrate-binding protein
MGREVESAQYQGGTLVEGRLTDLGTPWLSMTAGRYYGIHESLAEPHPDTSEPVGRLARSWEGSDDATTWTFSLQEGVTWHDGAPFTAEDVRFSYLLYSHFGWWVPVEPANVEVVDNVTIRFEFEQPSPLFTDVGTIIFPIVAEHVIGTLSEEELENIELIPANTGTDPSAVVGTGPFQLKEIVPGDHVTVVRYDSYWDGPPHLDAYVIKAVASSDALITQLKAGDIDVVGGLRTGVSDINPGSAQELVGSDVAIVDYQTTLHVFYATNLDPEKTTLFQDLRVRQALLHAVDRQALIEAVYFGYGEIAHSLLSPLTGHEPETIVTRYPYDPDLAKALLDEAGWTMGDNNVRQKDGQPLSFKILTEGGNASAEGCALILQEQWRLVAIEATIEAAQPSVWRERYSETHDWDVAIARLYGSDIATLKRQFHCEDYGKGGGNPTKYCNPEADLVLEQALSELDRERRLQLLSEYLNIVIADLPVGPLVSPSGVGAVNKRVHNLYQNGVNGNFNMETWWVER